jgi:hypothetical protein
MCNLRPKQGVGAFLQEIQTSRAKLQESKG